MFLSILTIFRFIFLGISYNRPRLCASAAWNSTAITFPEQNSINFEPHNIFVDINNTIYIVDRSNQRILMWLNGNINSSMSIPNITNIYLSSLFVTSEGEIYFDNVYIMGQVERWSINATKGTAAMYIPTSCSGLFIDINNTLYCSLSDLHQIVFKSLLDDVSNIPRIIAGTGCPGLTMDRLFHPQGIFVDENQKLYVADYRNNRIQRFQVGQPNATTVAGSNAPSTITLFHPTSVVLDADGYLFIVDQETGRIVSSSPTGFRCIVGCFGAGTAASDQLSHPRAMGFDSYGNIFVVDTDNNRIQKFLIVNNSCGM